MWMTTTPRTVAIGAAEVQIGRTTGGVAEIRGRDDRDLAAGLGYCHAHDRQVQMMLVRLAGQGRLCECLRSDAAMLAVDVFMRQMGFARGAARDVASLTSAARDLAEAYTRGVNTYVERHGRPFELRLVGYRPEPWRVEDTLLTIRLMSYVGLAQSQQDAEKLLVQAIQAGVSLPRLKDLFRPHLDGVDDELASVIRKVRIHQGLLPPEVRFLSALPRVLASNNWAVSGRRSASGSALQCNDPHLECNRLPAIWYELVGHTADDYRIGITMPGVPGLVMGRTREVSFGFTYGFMDLIDYFVEDCQGGRYRKGAERRDFARRVEVIRRKGGTPVELTILENDHGVLESDPLSVTLEDGYYLSRAWAGDRSGAAPALNALLHVLSARSVAEAQAAVREVTISCNWVLADRRGDVAYQQSGPPPARKHSGLHPVPGWSGEFDWAGIIGPEGLASLSDPPEGFVATANEDRNQAGKPLSINLPMGAYRAERIRELLEEKPTHSLDDMKRIQRDLYSKQAERFMAVLRPLVPDTPTGRLLLGWDLRYDRASRGATLFEEVYSELLREVFGKGLFGLEAWDATASETNLLADYYHVFDAVLLGGGHSWFGDEGREGLARRVVLRVLDRLPAGSVRPWGELRRVDMTNLFFGGKLPRLLGFDHGPVSLEGGRATVVQGVIFRAHGRTTTFCPSWRYVTDLGSDEAHTALAGGPSGRRLSKHYLTDVERWLEYAYKRLASGKGQGADR